MEPIQRRAKQAGEWHGWPAAILAAVVILGVYCFGATRTSLWDRDEPRYARATVEMLQSGNYLYPTFNDEVRAHKPILIYWLMAIAVKVLGPTELAFRLFSALGVTAACLLTYFMGRRLIGPGAGLWGMLVLAATPLASTAAKLATPDGVLLAFLTGATACFVASATRGVRFRHLAGLALCTAGAMLTKGPLGGAPILAIFVAWLIGRKTMNLPPRYLLWALLATLAAGAGFLAWAVPANAAAGGELLRVGVGYHVLRRATQPLESHGGTYWLWLPFYIPVVLVGFMPWLLHLPASVSAALGRRLGGPTGRAVLLAAAVPVFVVMTLAATKLPHYVLPIWPGLALMIGGAIHAWDEGLLTKTDRRWLVRGAWPFAMLGLAGGAAAIVGPWLLVKSGLHALLAVLGVTALVTSPWFLPGPDLRLAGAVLGALMLEMTVLGVRAHLRRGPLSSARVLLVSALVIELAIALLAAPALEEVKTIPAFARYVDQAVPAGEPVATCGFDEPSLNFYLGRHLHSFVREKASFAEVLDWLQSQDDGALIVTQEALDRLEKRAGPMAGRIIACANSFDAAKLRMVRLTALRRGPASTATTSSSAPGP